METETILAEDMDGVNVGHIEAKHKTSRVKCPANGCEDQVEDHLLVTQKVAGSIPVAPAYRAIA